MLLLQRSEWSVDQRTERWKANNKHIFWWSKTNQNSHGPRRTTGTSTTIFSHTIYEWDIYTFDWWKRFYKPYNYSYKCLTIFIIVIEQRRGKLQFICSQNVDGLHTKSGFPLSRLTDVHGNMFIDRCQKCGKQFIRRKCTRTVRFYGNWIYYIFHQIYQCFSQMFKSLWFVESFDCHVIISSFYYSLIRWDRSWLESRVLPRDSAATQNLVAEGNWEIPFLIGKTNSRLKDSTLLWSIAEVLISFCVSEVRCRSYPSARCLSR